jgi:type II secretory pathway component GspD/PulD (secretin)
MGSPVTLAFLESDTHEAFRLLADISGMNVVVGPGQFPDDRLSLSVRDVPWDNVWAAICESRDARLGIEGNLLSVSSLADASSAAAIESLRLENEDPAFFEPFARYLTSAGTLRADSESRTLVIRDVAPSLRRFRGWVRALDAHAGDGSGSGRDRR